MTQEPRVSVNASPDGPRPPMASRLMAPRALTKLFLFVATLGVIAWNWSLVWPLVPNWRASVALLNRDVTRAESWLQIARWGNAHHPETYLLLARCERRSGDWPSVHENLSQAKQLGADKQRVDRELWMTLAQSGQIAAVEPHLPGMLKAPGNDAAEICEAFATGYLRLRRFDEALTLLDAWLADEPNHLFALQLRGTVLKSLGRPHEAAADFSKALQVKQDLPEVDVELGEIHFDRGRIDKAEAHFKKCRVHTNVTERAGIGLARVYRKNGHLEAARSELDRLQKQNPLSSHAAYERGLLELECNHVKAAIEHLQQAITLAPQELEWKYALAQAYQEDHQTEKASQLMAECQHHQVQRERLQKLTDASLLAPENIGIRFELGKIASELGRREDALGWFQSILDRQPSNAEAQRLLDECKSKTAPKRMAPNK